MRFHGVQVTKAAADLDTHPPCTSVWSCTRSSTHASPEGPSMNVPVGPRTSKHPGKSCREKTLYSRVNTLQCHQYTPMAKQICMLTTAIAAQCLLLELSHNEDDRRKVLGTPRDAHGTRSRERFCRRGRERVQGSQRHGSSFGYITSRDDPSSA